MSVKDQVLQLVNKFKKENYLKDKTDAMAEGLLLGANLADEANELSKSVDRSFKRLQQEYTENGNGAQSTAELIAARDGEQVIDDRLNRDFGNVNTQLARNITKTEDNTTSPDYFEGVTDIIKVQSAVDYATENNVGIRFSRMYDLTGGTVYISKDNRRPLQFFGAGGGVKKTDAGHMFSAINPDVGDITSGLMRYESIPGKDSNVWDADKLIRITSVADYYVNIDHIAQAMNRWMQSYKFANTYIVGGYGWAIECVKSFDCTFGSIVVEHREHFFRNTTGTQHPANYNLAFRDSCVESLNAGGVAFDLDCSFGLVIENVYQEYNPGGYIRINKGEHFSRGLSFRNNTLMMSDEQKNDPSFAAIELGLIDGNGVSSEGNWTNGNLFKTENFSGGFVQSLGDTAEKEIAIGTKRVRRTKDEYNPHAVNAQINNDISVIAASTLIKFDKINKINNELITYYNGVFTASKNLKVKMTFSMNGTPGVNVFFNKNAQNLGNFLGDGAVQRDYIVEMVAGDRISFYASPYGGSTSSIRASVSTFVDFSEII